ncbi:YheC/YheD family protein [Thalassobacillus sp. C254]|uniref:YheC/YheD family protein n=1 Tax=Thalassobacillus sp. C254 TaxID=1225341 RepID=UPI0006D163F9|nr:YheC/YheD family protein [Thalassobacillus sp. C254]
MEVVLINPSSLGNWEVYNYFSSVKSLEKYLLETMLYTDPEDLFYMIKKHQTIYLKGVIGRKGKNVLRVEHLPSNEFQCTHYNYRKRKVYSQVYGNVNDLLHFIQEFYKDQKFMIQEGIDLLEIDNRRVDLRAELQRKTTGEVQVTGVSARMSQENSPITTHANAIPLNDLFTKLKLTKKERVKVRKRIKRFLLKTYKETEYKYGEFVEIGIDFALTKDMQIRFIECNSQSAKVSLLKAYGEKKLQEAMANIILFAQYRYELYQQKEQETSAEKETVKTKTEVVATSNLESGTEVQQSGENKGAVPAAVHQENTEKEYKNAKQDEVQKIEDVRVIEEISEEETFSQSPGIDFKELFDNHRRILEETSIINENGYSRDSSIIKEEDLGSLEEVHNEIPESTYSRRNNFRQKQNREERVETKRKQQQKELYGEPFARALTEDFGMMNMYTKN